MKNSFTFSLFSSKQKFLAAFITLFILAVIHTPVTWADIFAHQHNDYYLHLGFVENLLQGEDIPAYTLGHPVWQFAVLAISRIPFLSLKVSALLFQIAAELLLGLVLFELCLRRGIHPWLSCGLVVAVSLAAPVFLFAASDDLYYLGYLGITSYHNPTINWLKPLALLLFLFACQVFGEHEKDSWGKTLLSFVLMLLSTLLKPSFTICLLPVLGVAALYRLWKRRFIHWRLLLGGLALPAVLVLGWQYGITYNSGEAGVALMPLAVMRFYSNHLLWKFILSIWFPMLVSALFFKDVLKDRWMVLAWLVFFVGAGYTYLFAETGNRFAHGNFGWSGEIANFMLFTATVLFLASRKFEVLEERWKAWVAYAAGLAPHLVSGLIYYIISLTRDRFV